MKGNKYKITVGVLITYATNGIELDKVVDDIIQRGISLKSI